MERTVQQCGETRKAPGLWARFAPGLKRAAIMFNPDTSPASAYLLSLETAVRSLKVAPTIAPVHSDAEFETAIIALGREPGGGLVDVACGDELLEGGLCARKESLAGFGQADTAGRADEEQCTDAPLECAYRLTDRRWRHPELRGRPAKTPVLGNAQERLHTVERALPDCEVLLHSPSTLWRIVERGKRLTCRLQVGSDADVEIQADPPTSRTPVFVTENKGACRD